jgi:hypothetical protein
LKSRRQNDSSSSPHCKKRVKKLHKEEMNEEKVNNLVELNEEDIVLDINDVSQKREGEFSTAISFLDNFSQVLQDIRQFCEIQLAVDEIMRKEEDCKLDSVVVIDEKVEPENMACGICLGGAHDDDCNDDASSGFMIKLKSCQHFAHVECLKQQIKALWSGKKISFNYLQCGECRTPLEHDTLTLLLLPHLSLKRKVEDLCLKQAQADNLIDDFEEKLENAPNDTIQTCMTKLSCYMCHICSEPFCGGRVECADDDNLDVSGLKCPSCAFGPAKKASTVPKKSRAASNNAWRGKCHVHGYKFAIYKCDSCCSVATWDCRSNHYCTRCHDQASQHKDYKCPGKTCPLGIDHPPNKPGVHGTVDNGFVIGCSKCFLGEENKDMDFELATDFSSRGAVDNWRERFQAKI